MKKYIIEIEEVNKRKFEYGISNQLHGFLYESLGDILNHDGSDKEFTQYVSIIDNTTLWTINVIKPELISYFDIMIKLLQNRNITLNNYEFKVNNIEDKQKANISTKFKIEFVTPFFFKNKRTSKYYTRINTKHLIYKIAEMEEELDVSELYANLRITDINIYPQQIKMPKVKTTGMVGSIAIEYTGDNGKLLCNAVNKLSYYGYGLKTSLGYGGIKVYETNSKL